MKISGRGTKRGFPRQLAPLLVISLLLTLASPEAVTFATDEMTHSVDNTVPIWEHSIFHGVSLDCGTGFTNINCNNISRIRATDGNPNSFINLNDGFGIYAHDTYELRPLKNITHLALNAVQAFSSEPVRLTVLLGVPTDPNDADAFGGQSHHITLLGDGSLVELPQVIEGIDKVVLLNNSGLLVQVAQFGVFTEGQPLPYRHSFNLIGYSNRPSNLHINEFIGSGEFEYYYGVGFPTHHGELYFSVIGSHSDITFTILRDGRLNLKSDSSISQLSFNGRADLTTNYTFSNTTEYNIFDVLGNRFDPPEMPSDLQELYGELEDSISISYLNDSDSVLSEYTDLELPIDAAEYIRTLAARNTLESLYEQAERILAEILLDQETIEALIQSISTTQNELLEAVDELRDYINSVDDSIPTNPDEPTQPSEPDNPVVPITPTDPIEPVTPTDPIVPVTPPSPPSDNGERRNGEHTANPLLKLSPSLTAVADNVIELKDKLNSIISNIKADLEDIDTDEPAASNTWISRSIQIAKQAGFVSEAMIEPANLSRAITRAEFSQIIYDAFGFTTSEEQLFVDTESHANKTAISALYANGILAGYGEGLFLPEKEITRAEIVTILARIIDIDALILDNVLFTDIDGHWAQSAIAKFGALGIVTGKSDDIFDPNSNTTTEESIVVFMRLLNNLFELDLDI